MIIDKNHLAETIVKYSSVPTTPETARCLIDHYLKYGEAVYVHGELSGYLLVFNFFGQRSFHGYCFVQVPAVWKFRLIKKFIEDHDVQMITTTEDKTQVRRLGRLLGMEEKLLGGAVCLSK